LSLPGLTRQSILLAKSMPKKLGLARVSDFERCGARA
jgi:hypothetical protein